ncbi:MAG: single-stranded-DNA-specific exonuclease RecJ [Thermoleophilia bacterium]|nr:single-stranded-DNA-specific exonuclease RecJ [Thermoleophilia bacterium]
MSWRASRVRYAEVMAVQEALGCPEPVAWTLVRRGLGDPGAAREFLAADGPLEDPEALPGIAEAADRLALAVRGGERVVVHGDYDCDGVCSTAILVAALEARGARVGWFLPSRFTDGYGVSEATVERLAGEGCRLLVCVDCGTTAVGPLTRAAELGMDAIVADHHLAAGRRPPAIIANPALGHGVQDAPCAAGVVFRLTRALARRLDGPGVLAPDPEDAIDLVALATVADQVPLVGENRRLVARGLTRIREAPRPGVAALCRAAGVATRGVSARTLGFQLGPAVNAAGRLAHAGRALELMLAPAIGAAQPIADELWALNTERREVEQQVTREAVAIVEAEPEDRRGAAAILAVGRGWHEGVVGIVASRLVERFGRPAIVLTHDGDEAKGSGRSLPGVDLHALVAAASGRLTRWGGHAGAVGVSLATDDVAAFRAELTAAAEGHRGAIERARVRVVDAVVGGRDLDLATAEAIEALAPFGRGNPEVRLALPGCAATGISPMGQGHLQMRLQAGGVHARAVQFNVARRPEEDPARRYDAVVRLGVDRWQDMVGTKVVLDGLEPLDPRVRPRAAGLCAQACDAACPDRVDGAEILALVDAPDALAPAPAPDGPPLAVRDRRGEGAALSVLAALARADGGAVAVVADVPRRRAAFRTVLEPGRLGVDVAALAGSRCHPAAAAARVALARGGPLLAMVEYARLPDLDLPEGAHLVLVDPPAHADEVAWVQARAAGRVLHLAWGDPEAAEALAVAEAGLDLRPVVAGVWRALEGAGALVWAPDLEARLLGDGPVARDPRAVARALAVLREVGLARVDHDGVEALPTAGRRDLAGSARYVACAERLERARALLARAATLDVTARVDAAEPAGAVT